MILLFTDTDLVNGLNEKFEQLSDSVNPIKPRSFYNLKPSIPSHICIH